MNVGFYLGMNKNVIYTLAEIHPKKCKKRYLGLLEQVVTLAWSDQAIHFYR